MRLQGLASSPTPETQAVAEVASITPLLLTAVPEASGPASSAPLTFFEGQPIRIPSVLVIPGNVGYLKQFFSAQLFVANGAPAGAPLTVRDVTGTIRLPPGPDLVPGQPDDPGSDDPLALPETVRGPQPATLPVRGVGPDGEPGTADDVGALWRREPEERGVDPRVALERAKAQLGRLAEHVDQLHALEPPRDRLLVAGGQQVGEILEGNAQ